MHSSRRGISLRLALGWRTLIANDSAMSRGGLAMQWTDMWAKRLNVRQVRAAQALGPDGRPWLALLPDGREVWVTVHTKKDAGQLGNRILREAGVW